VNSTSRPIFLLACREFPWFQTHGADLERDPCNTELRVTHSDSVDRRFRPPAPMNSSDPVLFRQLPLIRKIIDDETWLEGERRGCHVSPSDPVVRERVCQVILRVGQQIREALSIPSHAPGAGGPIPFPEPLPPPPPSNFPTVTEAA
jgi:hypothetical protein